ncbi:hypothetical protein T4B_7625 [Trichinella pseudospiralis]|uniref:Uncharacterized protein n=1 Tax=Trichinella pseudospiralis TaxID=6337 RepID=A0A0V1HCH6_TRIPS|nr:hypothetical protein T4B_7625 [Trichinella pseudospiralis]KRZ36411.1 hypothetical protein T4C_8608 [Trichinella pseudospiralis]
MFDFLLQEEFIIKQSKTYGQTTARLPQHAHMANNINDTDWNRMTINLETGRPSDLLAWLLLSSFNIDGMVVFIIIIIGRLASDVTSLCTAISAALFGVVAVVIFVSRHLLCARVLSVLAGPEPSSSSFSSSSSSYSSYSYFLLSDIGLELNIN